MAAYIKNKLVKHLLIPTLLLILAGYTLAYDCSTDTNCASCNVNLARCRQCVSNYGFNNTDPFVTSCLICQVGSCNNCSTDAYYCDQCASGLGLSASTMGGHQCLFMRPMPNQLQCLSIQQLNLHSMRCNVRSRTIFWQLCRLY